MIQARPLGVGLFCVEGGSAIRKTLFANRNSGQFIHCSRATRSARMGGSCARDGILSAHRPQFVQSSITGFPISKSGPGRLNQVPDEQTAQHWCPTWPAYSMFKAHEPPFRADRVAHIRYSRHCAREKRTRVHSRPAMAAPCPSPPHETRPPQSHSRLRRPICQGFSITAAGSPDRSSPPGNRRSLRRSAPSTGSQTLSSGSLACPRRR